MNRLLPLLDTAAKQGSDVRIVCLGSVAPTMFIPATHEFPFLSPSLLTEPVTSYPWQWRYVTQYIFQIDMIRYGVSKTAVVLVAQELQRRLDARASPIAAVTVHPGEVATEFQMANNNALIAGLARLSFLTSEQGAANPLFAATAREVRQRPEEFRGRFIVPVGRPGTSHPIVEDRRQAEGLWENLTAQLNKELEAEGLPLLGAW